MDSIHRDLDTWAREAAPGQQAFRQAVHLVLTAITSDLGLRETMVMKGGLLMAIRYHSHRFTKDLDFSTSKTRVEIDPDTIRQKLERSLAMAVANSDYNLDCRIQRCRFNPPEEDAQFPNLELKIGYAFKGSKEHSRLLHGRASATIEIDFNLNEPIIDIETLDLGEGLFLRAYALSDLIAEKLRSLMQQTKRNRYRRQDIYDLRLLLELGVDVETRRAILTNLIKKSQSRGITPTPDSLADPEIRRRAQRDYPTLADEVEGMLPDFDESYNQVEAFYRALPWDGQTQRSGRSRASRVWRFAANEKAARIGRL
ncbi:MAG: nucleotidyl transferase AbiEii/AbiGii toxin family protein [Akkermansiaceae bacterium]|jgi:predicted nucleotidyltransferase component of viral defense system|nr:nucleotidyl transferase AbiEii/AbiGii toxin family protein [Akkermansiaceae bacterium]